jgi:branched-chain amino acid transport system ATP-binding protein
MSKTAAVPVLDPPPSGATDALLDVRGVSLNFGGINALSGIDLSVREREIFALIGPNGAGKSTLFNCITRLYKPTAGSISFAGHDLLSLQAHDLPAIGIARTFQNTALFPQLSVLDNVLVGAHHSTDHSAARAVLRTSSWRRNEGEVRERAEKLLVSLSLEALAGRRLSSLDFPTQKRVELARALLASPRLLLLDEPAGGLAREEAEELSLLVRKLRDEEGLTVLLVEHHMAMVMRLADRICVLDSGVKLAEGTPHEVQHNPDVIRVYLGSSRKKGTAK